MSYHVTTRLGDKTIAFQVPADDPFIRQTVTVGWPETAGSAARATTISATIPRSPVLCGGAVPNPVP